MDWIPRSIIVDQTGMVRYNGHPMDLTAGFLETLLTENRCSGRQQPTCELGVDSIGRMRGERRTMRRILVALAMMVMLLGIAVAAAPRIAVDSATYEFPDTVEGIAVAHTFILSNVGDQELVIESAGPSCSCTKITTELPANRLQPGQSVELYALLDTNGLSGRDPKQITVISNDPTRQPPDELLLTMVGNVTERQPYQTSVGELVYDSYVLLDVRDPADYAAGHVVGAMNIPASQARTVGH